MTKQSRFAWVQSGAHLRVVAPAGRFDLDAFERGIVRLRDRYTVSFDPSITAEQGYLAGDDERRLTEMRTAIEDERVDGIVAARGGYGATRLLDALDVELVASHPKLLVGFSDITALHALWARAGVGSIHGAMVTALGDAGPPQFDRWCAALAGQGRGTVEGLRPVSPGRAAGTLVGGNLAVLTALLGTPHWPPTQGSILFLEDVGERPYRVDRMLTTWHHAGVLRQVAGIVLGAFAEAAPGSDGVTVEAVLAERLETLGVPVAMGLNAGHITDNLEVPLGARVVLDADRGTLEFD